MTIAAWALAFLLASTPAFAVPFRVVYVDGAAEGFNDPSLGPARRKAFEYAIDRWAALLGGNVPVVVRASMDPLGGSATDATLAMAGPVTIHRDFPGALLANTWYVGALANQIAGTDLDPGSPEIEVVANSSIDGNALGDTKWYYGLDGRAGRDVDLVSVVLHEIGHGLHFIDTIAPPGSGRCGEWLFGFPGIFDRHLRHGNERFASMSSVARCSALTSDSVFWTGPAVTSRNGGPAKIYAPSPYMRGSSISHWDPFAHPNELMVPFYTQPRHDAGLAVAALEDMGWDVLRTPPADAPDPVGVPGTPDPVRAASLIVPLFQVDPNGAEDTLLVINNTAQWPVNVRREVWDASGARVASLADGIVVAPRGSAPISMRALIESRASAEEKARLSRDGRWRGFVTFDAISAPSTVPPTDPSYPFAPSNVLEGWIYYTRLTEGSSNGMAMLPIEHVGNVPDRLLRGFYRPEDGRERIDADARVCADRLVRGLPCMPDGNGIVDRIECRLLSSGDLAAETRLVLFAWRPGTLGGPMGMPNVATFDESGSTISSTVMDLPDVVNVLSMNASHNGWIRVDGAVPADRQVYAFVFNSAKPPDASLNWDAIFRCNVTP